MKESYGDGGINLPCFACNPVHAIQNSGFSLDFDGDVPKIKAPATMCDCACHLNPVKKIPRKVKP